MKKLTIMLAMVAILTTAPAVFADGGMKKSHDMMPPSPMMMEIMKNCPAMQEMHKKIQDLCNKKLEIKKQMIDLDIQKLELKKQMLEIKYQKRQLKDEMMQKMMEKAGEMKNPPAPPEQEN